MLGETVVMLVEVLMKVLVVYPVMQSEAVARVGTLVEDLSAQDAAPGTST